ncbi:PREDICTED: uncharacterized protein LOC109244834 [Nicotiana attenuata]|uniref:DUF4408 domain-containing protein n=1 Tax=Nicotiana attenuata TaxID=49451 RepID=A0A1J6J742_NICAT|nr:PREDICTED: uncharacterized protein LOC109244834 [Nicotiana attenuata]OIT05663.1 hypothetical protein A4A49_21581 [Nicotiana attenuata]
MAPSTNSLILSLKVVLISIGAVSLAMVLKASIPFVFYELPTIWSAVIAWLKPPYLYVVINGIIIIIAATSRSSNHKESSSSDQFQPLITSRTPPQSDLIAIAHSELHSVQSEVKEVLEAAAPLPVTELLVLEVKPVVVNGSSVVDVNPEDGSVNDEPVDSDAVVISKSVVAPLPETDTETELLLLKATEKPLVSSRFGNRKPPVKTSPEGLKALRVARSKKPETLENTWKMITEGRHVPLTRHLNKSDTFQDNRRHVTVDAPEENENSTTFQPLQQQQHHQRHVLKSETFKDRTNYDSPSASPSPSAAKLLKEPSPSADELNRRVEAFIKKFNEDMRIQRQQSMQQYMEMINRGV